MQKLYENFHIFYFQKRIVSAETIRGNMVFPIHHKQNFRFSSKDWTVGRSENLRVFHIQIGLSPPNPLVPTALQKYASILFQRSMYNT